MPKTVVFRRVALATGRHLGLPVAGRPHRAILRGRFAPLAARSGWGGSARGLLDLRRDVPYRARESRSWITGQFAAALTLGSMSVLSKFRRPRIFSLCVEFVAVGNAAQGSGCSWPVCVAMFGPSSVLRGFFSFEVTAIER